MPIPPLGLVLDLDGTLVDSLPDIQISLCHALAQLDHREAVRLVAGDDGLDDLRGEQGQIEHPGEVGALEADGLCEGLDGGEAA